MSEPLMVPSDLISVTGVGKVQWDESVKTELHVVEATEADAYPDMIAGVPVTWLEKYAGLAMDYAQTCEVDPGVWYAEVPGLPGAGATGDTEDEALAELPAVIVGWVAVKLRVGAYVPVVGALDLNPPAAE